jgi:hypothetical protein
VDSPTPLNLAPPVRARARKTALGWSDVVRALQRPEVRELVLGRYRAAGHTPESFSKPAARAAMADALTRCEDFCETEHPRWQGDREALAVVRRLLETELT